MAPEPTEKQLAKIMAEHEAWLREHSPDLDEESLQEELALLAAMEVTRDVEGVYYVCVCGRKHYVEYTPPPHQYYAASSTCACGHKVVFGE